MKHYLLSFITRHVDTHAKKMGEFFGKKGQESDLVFYSSLEGNETDGRVFMSIIPRGYPDKLKSLIQSLAITDFHILVITPDEPFDALLGEMIIALGSNPSAIPLIVMTGITKMNEYLIEETTTKVQKIISATTLGDRAGNIIVIRNFIPDMTQLRDSIVMTASERIPDRGINVKILIDSVFPVKGIGTVVLGIVRSGSFDAGAMLELTSPQNTPKNVIAKSIQKHDTDCKNAGQGDRVGLALKGIKPEDVSRDNMLVSKGTMKQVDTVAVRFTLSRFSKKSIDTSQKQLYHVAIDHQIFPATPVSLEGTKAGGKMIPGEESVVIFKSEKNFNISKEGDNWATITILEKFSGTLRILGSGPVQQA
ncbi:MAG: EF-Tu/IF-2/RF-3 family GTPase [Promethearchaeota archaeon]